MAASANAGRWMACCLLLMYCAAVLTPAAAAEPDVDAPRRSLQQQQQPSRAASGVNRAAQVVAQRFPNSVVAQTTQQAVKAGTSGGSGSGSGSGHRKLLQQTRIGQGAARAANYVGQRVGSSQVTQAGQRVVRGVVGNGQGK